MRYIIAITCFLMMAFYSSTYNVSVAQVAEATIAKEVFKQAEPSVVLIEVYNEKGEVFGKGSGFIVSTDGKILTNYHVIEHTKKATVRLANGDAYDTVDVIDIDKRKDIALIKIRAVELKALTLGKSVTTEVGEKVYCLGNPLGALRNTLSEGIISALRAGDGYKYFQISAPISHGSSGSPVMNSKGEVIGIAVASIEEGQSLNFAIPIDYAKGMLTATGLQTLASIYEPPKEETTKADSYET
ncbi:MAG: trypsin-like peptidase domain-containing protein, partial [Blastocatellia bacterium]|nr:trypsin-like peptidase domain-containing protein [Blastocatellia bacterium]